ncbi:hypothetical protein CesoFtcFv8_027010 [Champsocephalus esox]|uniref:Uncharacterized protein n=1 Tax=Champsocephalus esox TaxID=159716 RepID=A0AAN8G8E0_9TELE|nr:hypothetical protein CesoFtcFv8_027010 [Champsocephalus esox]
MTPVGSPALPVTRAHVHTRTLVAEHHERQKRAAAAETVWQGGRQTALTLGALSRFDRRGKMQRAEEKH